jgi:hypothetical protein
MYSQRDAGTAQQPSPGGKPPSESVFVRKSTPCIPDTSKLAVPYSVFRPYCITATAEIQVFLRKYRLTFGYIVPLPLPPPAARSQKCTDLPHKSSISLFPFCFV